MNIFVMGTGNVGGTLGTRWAQKGHTVVYGTRDPESAKVQALLSAGRDNASATSDLTSGTRAAAVVLLAMPWSVAEETAAKLGDLTGKTLIDATNPIGPDFQLAVGHTSSGAEEIAKRAPGANVVKAFNTTGFNNMDNPVYNGESTTMFICGDDTEAKRQTTQLAEELGFDVADVGNLATARYLEPLAMVWINLAMAQGMGRDFALKLVKR